MMGGIVPPSLTGIHVLVVDDHEDNCFIYEIVLEHCGAVVTVARSACHAIECCARLRPDIVVTDLAMPDEDGVWLADRLRTTHHSLPIIAVSGFVDLFDKRLKGAQFRRVLQKPVDPWELAAAIAAAVEIGPDV
jgi:CheY-like chemotaxis protein